MAAIRVDGLERTYGDVRALKGISFAVDQGEVFGLLGPNGAGKTTTVRILTGLLRPTAGSASVAGCDVVSERAQLQPRIGVVFEAQNVYERLTGRANLAFAAGLYGVNGDRVDTMLDWVGLSERANDRVKTYSNGMKQRLLIARALLHGPAVLFLDEPTRGLDPNVAREIRTMVQRLAERGVTVLLTTHYMEEEDRLCRRVAILDRGEIAALGTPEDLKREHGQDDRTTLEDVFVHLTGRYLGRGGEGDV